MRTAFLLGAGVALVACGQGLSRDDNTTRAPNFVGTWTIIAGVDNGEKVPADRIEGSRVRITKDGITVADNKNKQLWAIKYEADLAKKPHPITMTLTDGPKKGMTAHGVIQLQDDVLRLCYTIGDEKAPTDFTSAKGSKRLSFTMKRVKADRE